MAKKAENPAIEITPPNFKNITLRACGLTPMMMHKFSEKSKRMMQEAQTAVDKTKKKRQPKDYKAEFLAAKYISTKGWEGIPAHSFRNAMIAACRTVQGLAMTQAKGAFFIVADGREKGDGTPLVKIFGKSVHDTRPVRLESGVADLRNRPRYDDWYCNVKIQFDADKLSVNDVANLFSRAGLQVGVGELRPQGKKSFGGDYGMWSVASAGKSKAA